MGNLVECLAEIQQYAISLCCHLNWMLSHGQLIVVEDQQNVFGGSQTDWLRGYCYILNAPSHAIK